MTDYIVEHIRDMIRMLDIITAKLDVLIKKNAARQRKYDKPPISLPEKSSEFTIVF